MVKLERSYFKRVLWVLPLVLVLHCYELVSEPIESPVAELFIGAVFGRMSIENTVIYIVTIQNLAFIVLFNMLFSGYIASHFRYSCVYVFTRLKSRRKWFLCRIAEITVYAFAFMLLFLFSTLLICITGSAFPLKMADMGMIIIVFVFAFMIVLNTTIVINLLAIRYGVVTSIFVVEAVLLVLIALSMKFHAINWLTMLNPVSCLNLFSQSMILRFAILGNNLIILAAILVIGRNYIEKYDIALFDAELN